jgi:hypothetical protein
MTTETQDKHPQTAEEAQAEIQSLEAELEEVRRELTVRNTRIGGIELAAFFALLLGIVAIIAVAFKLDDNQNVTTSAKGGATPMHNQMPGVMGGGFCWRCRFAAGDRENPRRSAR